MVKRKSTKDKQRSTKHTYKAKDRSSNTNSTENPGWTQVFRKGKQC